MYGRRLFLISAFWQLSEAKQKTNRYACGIAIWISGW